MIRLDEIGPLTHHLFLVTFHHSIDSAVTGPPQILRRDEVCKPEGLNTFEKLQFHSTGPPIYTRKAISELESSAEFLNVFPPQFQLQASWGVTGISSPERLDELHVNSTPFYSQWPQRRENLGIKSRDKRLHPPEHFIIGNSKPNLEPNLVKTLLKTHACFMVHGVC